MRMTHPNEYSSFTKFLVYCLFALFCLTYLVVLRVINIRKNRRYVNKKKVKACKLMAVFGSGGHTSEMLTLLEGLSQEYSPRTYVLADTDERSRSKIEEMTTGNYDLVRIKRSREVAQSWPSTVLTTLWASLNAIHIMVRYKPDLIICNGPGTCVPICGAAFLLKLCFVLNTRIVFVESICRVKTLSMSGQILYNFADRVLVQWPDLLKEYPEAQYIGRLV